LLSHHGQFAAGWLNAVPIRSLGLKLTDGQLRISIATRLGINICQPHTCVCGAKVEADGIHGLSCRKSSGRFSRHNQINDIVKRALASANVPAVLEPTGLSLEDDKRPDSLTLVHWERGCSLVWDATVVDALAPSRLARNPIPLAAAEEAEQKKLAKYSELTSQGLYCSTS
jgi:hypothetical protein